MPHPEQQYVWSWDLNASPEALWPLVSNTDRFNRDCGFPDVKRLAPAPDKTNGPITNARRLQAKVWGLTIEWDELAFEWMEPRRFGVERNYRHGPIAKMVVTCSLEPRLAGGTKLTYGLRIVPAGWPGRIALPWSIGRRARANTERVFRRYDEIAVRGRQIPSAMRAPTLAPGGRQRLTTVMQELVQQRGQPASLVGKLIDFITTADDLSMARIRPYTLADEWKAPRRDLLHLFLHATRAGLFDFSWDLVCPHCRGTNAGLSTLSALRAQAHCDSCNVDFTANFDQSVELTFTPNAAIRSVTRVDYCVGGPQVTPHIVAQQRLGPAEERMLQLRLTPGRYRIRAANLAAQIGVQVAPGGPTVAKTELAHPNPVEIVLGPTAELTLSNPTDRAHLVAFERTAWTDQATTAAEVTSLQLFRDLFSREVLRAGEQISVGTLTIVFTDLKNSTQLYQTIGDAPAFGRVLTHFDVLKAAVADEGGSIVKTMGDAIMAVFPRSIAAVRAMIRAHRELARPAVRTDLSAPTDVAALPLALKAGIHRGPCLAINQNDRLDYFGTTVNTAARLCGQCCGPDLVLSSSVCSDPEVANLLETAGDLPSRIDHVRLKGLGEIEFQIRRVSP